MTTVPLLRSERGYCCSKFDQLLCAPGERTMDILSSAGFL